MKKNRILALLLAVVMVIGMVPTAFATETDPTETTEDTVTETTTATTPVVVNETVPETTEATVAETTEATVPETTEETVPETTEETVPETTEETVPETTEETVPETTEETIPETTEETVPETTEETIPEELTKEDDASGVTIQVSGNIPEEVTLSTSYVREAGFFSFFGSDGPSFNTEIYDVISPLSEVAFAFDITLTNEDGSEWQPESGETVTVTLDVSPFEIEEGTKLGIAHDHEGTITKLGEYTVADGKLTFTTDGFSVFYGYTVDFEYDGTWHSIGGGGIILLSELFEALGIERSVNNVTNVEFSDSTLISVSYEDVGSYVPEYDWVLRSLEPFDTEELLTVSFNNDDILYINVFDATYTSLTNGKTYGNDTLNGNVSVSGNVTITVNGTLTLNGNITIPKDATLTINGTGVIKRGNSNTGAMFTVANGGKLNINAITIDGAASWTATQIDGSTRKTLTVSGVQAQHSAIYAAGGATIKLNGTKIQNLYTTKYAAAIHTLGTVGNTDGIAPSTVTLTNVKIDKCASTSDSSILLLNYSYATLSDCEITNNYAGYRYAGIVKAGGPSNFCLLKMNNCTASNNYSSGWGGVILWAANTSYSGTKTEAIITNCTFTNNTARYLGGAISNEAVMTVSGCTITENTAMSGGGIATFPYTRTEIDEAGTNACGLTLGTGNTIQNNTAAATGTFAPFSSAGNGADGDAEDVILESPITYMGGGGGIWCYMNKAKWTCSLEIGEGNTIQNNIANNLGGGVYVDHVAGNATILKITGADILNNTASNGGGVAVTSAKVIVESGDIKSNTATNFGGGVYVNTVANRVDADGNAIKGSCTVTGSGSVSSNSAKNGGGIYIDESSSLSISGGTITGNAATGTPDVDTVYNDAANTGVGGGIYVAKDSTFAMDAAEGSSVGLYGNFADFAADDAYASGNGTTLTIPDVTGMPLSGTDYSAAEGWFLDYYAQDVNYTSALTGFSAANPGRYRTADGTKVSAGTKITGGEKFYCLTLGQVPVLWINKTVKDEAKPDQSFRFHVTGTDVDTWVTLNPEDFTNGTARVKVGMMPTGSIIVTEDTAWSWRYKFDSVTAAVDKNYVSNGTAITVNLTDSGDEVFFTNERSDNMWLDFEYYADNTFSPDNK